MASEGIHIALKAEPIAEIGGFVITNTLLMSWIVVFLLSTIAFFVGRRLSLVPGKGQLAFEELVGGLFSYVEETLESRELARRYFPIIATIFVYILIANLLGLFPGIGSILVEYHGHSVPLVYPVNTDLNVTLALAVVAVLTIEVAGVAALGFLKYAGKFVNFSSVIGFLVGIIELLSEVARLISFSFRLFGNIFAGKVLILVVMFFVPFILPVPLMLFEVFVGFIQAAIFALLTLFFIKIAVAEPH